MFELSNQGCNIVGATDIMVSLDVKRKRRRKKFPYLQGNKPKHNFIIFFLSNIGDSVFKYMNCWRLIHVLISKPFQILCCQWNFAVSAYSLIFCFPLFILLLCDYLFIFSLLFNRSFTLYASLLSVISFLTVHAFTIVYYLILSLL